MELGLGALYSEQAVAAGVTTEKADLIFASVPYRIMHASRSRCTTEMASATPTSTRRLEAAGFLLDFGEDGSGLFMKYLRRGSGYYIDVGASELVANGTIKLAAASRSTDLTETRSCSTTAPSCRPTSSSTPPATASMNG